MAEIRNAVPTPTHFRKDVKPRAREEWERIMDNYDRSERRRESVWRGRVVRLEHGLVALIGWDRTLYLSDLNDLGPVKESDLSFTERGFHRRRHEGKCGVALPE